MFVIVVFAHGGLLGGLPDDLYIYIADFTSPRPFQVW